MEWVFFSGDVFLLLEDKWLLVRDVGYKSFYGMEGFFRKIYDF